MRIARINGIDYTPLVPQPDTDSLADAGARVIFRHGSPTQPESKIFVAPRGEINAGWVIGFACV